MAKWPYNTAQWRRVRREQLSLHPWCQYCRHGRLTIAREVDHVKPINQGGDPWDMSNLRSTCSPCHASKTRNTDVLGKPHTTRKQKGCDAQGRPLDESHPWNQQAGGARKT